MKYFEIYPKISLVIYAIKNKSVNVITAHPER